MAALTGNSVGTSYQGLLKTTDNAAISGVLKNMTDGAGNATPLSMANNYLQVQAPTIEFVESTGGTNLMMISPANVYFEGAVDFTNASVTGIGGGLILGVGSATNEGAPKSMISGASVSTVAAYAAGGGDIVLGENAATQQVDATFPTNNITIGTSALTTNSKNVTIGALSRGYERSTAIGYDATATGLGSVSIGRASNASGGSSVSVGEAANATNSNAIAIGSFNGASGSGGSALGWAAGASTTFSIGIGRLSNQSGGNEQIAIGNFARANQEKGIAIGAASAVNAVGGVALGRDVVNAKADTVSVTELETQLAGGGITMKSPNGTEYKLTVSDAGALVIT